ncbi:hypothetical protein NDU88_007979 [Pleurodeles waltl]|uniref:Uncharacterized protein n=1 Tax=Pleurodeles waltl TaxID=8319 RepID=A0AAV7PMU6_PLEWA|nr:hypothetical protein NDU88_007979 [Pleurodeles waltl]
MPPRKNGRGEEETPSEERGVSGLATRDGTDVKDQFLQANEGEELSDKREPPAKSSGLPSYSEVSAEEKDAYLRSARRESRTFSERSARPRKRDASA